MAQARVVADRFLELAKQANNTLTPMQVLKLVYIAHGWMLGLYSKPLINENIQAWQYGPVIPDLYSVMRNFRSSPVTGKLSSGQPSLGAEEDSVVQQVYEIYGRLSGPALSRLTHQPGTPWDVTYQPGVLNSPISNDIIEDHYAALAAKASV